MDVVLLDPEQQKKNKIPPKKAKTIANRNAEGASSSAKDSMTRVAKAPVPSKQKKKPRPTPPLPAKKVKKAKKPAKRPKLIAKKGVVSKPKTPQDIAPGKHREHKPVPTKPIPLANLMPSSMALSQLSRDFERERRMKQMLSHEADIPINTREAKYAPYAHDLVRALEEQWRPDEADYQHFTDNERRSMMRITIEHNGELGGVEILHPSPIPQINESAVEAIHAAAPFKPLPNTWGLDRVSFYLTFEVVNDKFVFKSL